MPLPDAVQELVARYKNNRAEYHSGHYNETQTRIDFVNPLFAALGWDMDNSGGLPEAYRQVVHEDAIKIGGTTKAPDYSFRVGGQRKFFLETKKPGVGLFVKSEPAYQLRRYAWTAKMPVSILTNFEEFAVYDGRVIPDQKDSPKKARLDYFKYTDYAEKWDELAARFSQSAVQDGAFDRYAEEATLFKASQPVDAAFLTEISGWREKLARQIAQNNAALSPRDLNFAVQMIIDRIIFLRICEDRGVETEHRLQPLLNGGRVYPRLLELFHHADARYNSGLFHFTPEKGRTDPDDVTPPLTIDDRTLKEIIAGVYYPESPFEFSVFPADILGHVYEQFLGKVIRVEGRSARVEEKPEVKKAGGVYYTPTYIVDYIVKHTVGKLLEGKTPKQAAALRVLDPACGSGSFLIGAYQHLLDWHTAWYIGDGTEKWSKGTKATLYAGPGGAWRLTTAERKRILLNNIYGVDIDSQAVEVTKLSLLLKVLEGENAETVNSNLKLFKERALPDLGDNIKCGNSLIGPDFYADPKRADLDMETQLRINAFDWQTEFAGIMKQGGFDAVIGNPPYGADYTELDKNHFQARFKYKKGKPETYIYFIEQGLDLLRPDGSLGFIVPNAWLTNYYGVQIRRYLLENSTLQHLVDLEPVRVFSKAVVDTSILVLTKGRSDSEGKYCSVWLGTRDFQIRRRFDANPAAWQEDQECIINLQAEPAEVELLQKLEESGVTLNSVTEYSQGVIPYKTEAEGKANLFICAFSNGEGWLPLLQSASQVRRYEIEATTAFIKYGSWLWCERESRFFTAPKILFHRVRKKLPRQLVGMIDETGIVNRHSLSNLILREGSHPNALTAVLGLFNSRLANWWFVKKFGLLMEVGGFKIGRLPLPQNWNQQQEQLANRVERLLTLHKELPVKTGQEKTVMQRQIEATDRQIDALVYELYGLTEDEIKIVEGMG